MAQRGKLASVSVSTDGTTWNKVGGRVDGSFSVSTDTIESTNADSAGWKEYLEGDSSAQLQFSCHYSQADTGQAALVTNKFDTASTLLKFKWLAETGATKDSFTGDGIVTSLEHSADDPQRMSVTVQITGAVTKAAQSA